MKKIITNPLTYVAVAVVGIIIYLMVKDGGLKVTTTMTPAAGTSAGTSTTVAAA